MTLIPFGPWQPDLPATGNEGVSELVNALPESRGYCGFPDLQTFGDTLDTRCKGLYGTVTADKTEMNFAGDAAKLYRLISDAWTDESVGGGYSLATDDFWDATRYGNLVLFAARYEDVQQFDVETPPATFTALSASAPQGAHIAVIRNQVVLGNVNDAVDGDIPHRVAWGPLFNPTGDWTPSLETLAGNRDLGGDGGWVQRIIGGEFGVVFQELAIWRMTFAGPPTKFQLDRIEEGQGTPAPKSPVKFRDRIYYYGQNGFHFTKGGGGSVPIGAYRVDDFFFRDADSSRIQFMIGAPDHSQQRIYWAYVSNDAPNQIPDKIIGYDIPSDRWGYAVIPTEYIGLLRTGSLDMDTDLNALYPDLDLLTISLDSQVWSPQTRQIVGFNGSHNAGWFTGTHLPATIVTGQWQAIEGKRSIVQNMRPMIESASLTSLTGNMEGSTKLTDAFAFNSADVTMDDEGDCPVLSAGRYHRGRVKTTGDFRHAVGIDVPADQVSPDGDH